ncbi:restriction endonuclease subunit S [Acinetobacter sp. YH12075]|uniref:restriction endonuclease subunit S n=1 Tax=Acinetobacter sp. YH12075 TaxID=2601070 RepID=UPI0015D161CB|nr:restriction endonuclease subunit S [Acinetobacter sp. YH12075]
MFKKYDAYKDSGIDWVGKIPAHWNVLKLGGIFEQRNQKVSDKDYPALSVTKNGIVPQLDNAAKTKDGDNRKLVLKGDFVINSRSDRKGSSGLSSLDGSVSLINIVLKPRKIEPKFSHHLMKCNAFIEEYYRVGRGIVADLWTTRFEEMKTMNLALPSVDEQRQIADFLDQRLVEIDQAIAIKEQQIALLNERKQIVIQKAVTQGLNPNVAMKDSGVEWIGKIPEHWQIKKLKFICKSQGRIGFKGYSSDDLVDQHEGALTLGATHLNWNGEIVLDQPVYLSWKKYYESPEIMVKKDDILIVQRGSTCGKVAIVDKDYGRVTINPSLVLLKEFKENPYFCVEGIKVVLNGILNEVSKTAIPMISQFQINNIEIALPPQNEQMQIIEYINEIQVSFKSLIDIKFNEIEKLKEYKTTLINDAVTGKIKVA